MTGIPCIPESAPFNAEQRLWLNGYLAGLFSDARAGLGGGAPPALPAPARPLLILFGSQTGSAEGLAKATAKDAEQRGFAPRLVGMEKHEGVEWASTARVLVITSTYGDGEPPDNATGFWSFLTSDSAPRLERTLFSVLALGDTNYPAFCEFGKKCDERLEALGARRIQPRSDCDVDYEAAAKAWREAVFTALASGDAPVAAISDRPALGADSGAENTAESGRRPPLQTEGYSRKNPFPARLLANRLLNAAGSAKEVRHYEISLAGSGLAYEAGDALGVLPANCPALVSDLLVALACDGEEAVGTPDGGETSLRMALLHHYDISKPCTDLLKLAAARSADAEFCGLLDAGRRDDLKQWLYGREVIDVLARLNAPLAAAEFLAVLKKLQPRLYSISSSPKAHPGEVHLTVAAVRYDAHDRSRKGICSTFLADRARLAQAVAAGAVAPELDGEEPTPVPVFVQTSHGFRLPADTDRPVIMVGPGTGIAPFRAFLEERRATGARGRNWLFFGDQRRATDYLYEDELEAMRADGHLARLDLAFSRDQAEKIYVQTRMLEAAPELWSWLEAGAHFYVCGDASRMAKDVDAALHTVCETAGGLSKEAAAEYVARLRSDKRYQRDVY